MMCSFGWLYRGFDHNCGLCQEPITWNPLINDFWFQTKMLWPEALEESCRHDWDPILFKAVNYFHPRSEVAGPTRSLHSPIGQD